MMQESSHTKKEAATHHAQRKPAKKAVKSKSLFGDTNEEKQCNPKLKANNPARIQRECPECGNDKLLKGSFNLFGEILKYKCPKCHHQFDSLNP
ncbi:MAG: hypothetical protein GY845_23705 [Planctomycetes bacterium]|nr:hypothetical protein [Planctomycetota bacterium]